MKKKESLRDQAERLDFLPCLLCGAPRFAACMPVKWGDGRNLPPHPGRVSGPRGRNTAGLSLTEWRDAIVAGLPDRAQVDLGALAAAWVRDEDATVYRASLCVYAGVRTDGERVEAYRDERTGRIVVKTGNARLEVE